MAPVRAESQEPEQPPAGAPSNAAPEQPAGTASEQKEKPPAEDKGKPKDSDEAEDLARTLEQGEVEAVSRVMGQRIVASAVQPYVHGTVVVDWRWGDGTLRAPNTLELRESHLYVGAHILEFAQPEVFVELEQRNVSDPPVSTRYAQLDLRLYGNLAVLRAGLFLVPFGIYNTELFLRYKSKLLDRPDLHQRLVPSSWSEVGVEVFGRWEWSPNRALRYYAYVTNGQTGRLTPSRAGYDPAYRALTGAKSAGARVAVQPLDGLSVGLSGYRGAMNGVDGALLLAGLDAIFRYGRFSADGELIYGQRLDPTPIPESGFYVAAGYKVTEVLEPVASVGGTSTSSAPDENELDFSVGLSVYPAPERFPTAVLKASYERELYQDGTAGNRLAAGVAIGF